MAISEALIGVDESDSRHAVTIPTDNGVSHLNRLWRLVSGNSAVSIADQLIVSGVNFLTVVLIGRFLTKQDLGIYSLAFSIIIFLRSVQETLITAPYTYLHHKQGVGYAGSALIQHLGMSGLLTLPLLLAGVALYLAGYQSALLSMALIVIVVGPLILFREFARQINFAHLTLRECLVLDGVVAAGQLSGLAILVSIDWLSVPNIFLIIGVAVTVPSLAWLRITQRLFILKPGRWRSDLLRNWRFGRWMLAGHLLGSVSPFVVPWALLTTSHGVEAVGVLAASAGVAGLSNTLVVGLNNLLSARAAAAFAQGGIDALQRVLVETGGLVVGLLSGFTVLFLLLGNHIASALYGEDYADAGSVIAILSLGMLMLGISIAAGNGLCVLGRPAANLKADLTSFVAMVISVFILLGPYGVKGAAAATVISNLTGMMVRLWTYTHLAGQQRLLTPVPSGRQV
jgi:O-antigen/teichoic acid export membrane protein